MESEIDHFGAYLEDCEKNNKQFEADKIIKYIRSYLDENVGSSILNYIISKVFDDDFNLLKFLSKIADLKWKSLLSGYELLFHFLQNFKENMRPYASEISKTCIRIAMSKASAGEKAKYVEILCHILREGYDLPPEEIVEIYNQFYKFCGVFQDKTSVQLQKKIFTLLGIIGKNHNSIIQNYESLVSKYLRELTSQTRLPENKREKYLISGCMEGLSDLLDSFSIEDVQTKSNIYGIAKKLLMLNSGNKTFDVRDVVIFVSKHCEILSTNLYEDDPQLWHKKILEFTTSTNSDNRKAGHLALEKFYAEMARILHARTEEKDKRIFEYFYEYFLKTMQDSKCDLIEIRLAIRGFGIFSAPSEVHMKKEKLTEMFIIIVVRLENDYFTSDALSVEQLEYLPDYIHCFSTILHQIGEYSADQIESLQKISVLMIKSFPKFSSLFHYSVFDSLILTMYYLHQYNPKCLRDYLQHVIYQGVLWSCSHRTTFDVDLDINEDDNNTTTYKSYVSLWKNLLSFSISKNPKYASISIANREVVVQAVYDELIKTLLQLINKLNYKTKFLDEDVPSIDPSNSEAEKLDDYIIFINVVELYTTLLPTNYACFKKWIKMYSTQIIFLSLKYPFVSGFYKLLRISLQMSDQLNYYAESKLDLEDRNKSFQSLLSFLQKVVRNVQEYRDDLQISCLLLLLSIPITFVPQLLHPMDSIFSMALSVGRGYLKLAECAVDTLDKWYQIIPEEDLKPILKSVLPHFDTFLQSKGFSGDPDAKLSLLQGKKPKKSKRKVIIENDGELVNLQHKILMFLGQLNSELCNFMVESNMEVTEVPWESEPQLKFTLPYKEVKPNIYLDKLVPRVLELAMTSGDQKTRITACELLHSIVIFMLGTSRKMSPTKQKELVKLFEKVMLPLVHLGCDSNEVVRQLFNPLVFQIVHWYSNPLQFLSSETSILVDILMDGLSHPSNTSVRDLSGKCVKDFVKWTIRQLKEGELEKYNANIKTVVSKISLYLVHPNSFKRLGATLAFNNIYIELREEESMVDMYWFQLFYSLMFSLSLQSSQTSNNQIEQALKHIERVIREKRILFNTYSDKREIPSAIMGPFMKDLVFWILQQTGSTNLNYRRSSIKLYYSLAAYVDDSATAKDFILKFVETDDPNWFITLYEQNGIKEITTLDNITTEAGVAILIKWLKNVIRCLDAYKYLLDYKIVTYDKIMECSKIHQATNYYIQHISNKALENAMELIANFNDEQIFAEEIKEYNQVKHVVNIAIFDYFIAVLDQTTNWSSEIYNNCLWAYLSSSIFLPNNLVALNIEESIKKLEDLLKKLFEKLPDAIKNDFKQHLSSYFTSNCVLINLKSSNTIPLTQRHLLKGWILLKTCSFEIKLPEGFNNVLNCVFEGLVDHREIEYGKKLSPTVEEYSKLLLKIYFMTSRNFVTFCACLTNDTMIKDPDNFTLIATGDYFMKCYEDIVLKYALENLQDVTKTLFKYKDFSKLTRQIDVLKNILSSYTNNSFLKNKFKNLSIMEIILLNWEQVFEISASTELSVRNQQIDLLLHIIKTDQNKNTNIGKNIKYFNAWFINNMNYYPDLSNKNILQFKIKLLEFNHCATGPEDDENKELISAFDKLKNYMCDSNNGLEMTDHVLLFKNLLNQLFKSKSRILIEPVLDAFLKIRDENLNINIDEKIHSYLSSISVNNQYKSVMLICKLISADKFGSLGCYKIAKIFLLPMLRSCSYEAFENFFVESIKEIFSVLKDKTQEDTINCLTQKTIKFILLDVLFSRIKVSAFAEKNCAISKAAFGDKLKTGREVLQETIRIIKSVRKEDKKFEDSKTKECYRLYQCEAFNAFISAISNTKTSPDDLNIYFHIFVEDKGTGEYIWERIIDCNEKILIRQCFDAWPKMKKTFINIRNENRAKQHEAPVQYIESQSLFNSTLSEDVSKFDFSNTLVRAPEILEAITTFNSNFVEMEGVDINDHECMATLCGLVNYLIDSKISPLPSNFKTPSLPKWLETLRTVLGDENTKDNVKIFLARMIHNMKFIFKYYGKHFFQPIVNFIVNGCTGEGFNYFVTDLIQMLLSWSHDLDLDDVKLPVNNLITYLITHSHNDRTDMLKSNLEIIKSCMEMWKLVIEVPHDQLFNILCSNNMKLLGIHLVGIILANGLIPWTNVNVKKFNKTLVNILQNETQKVIFKPTAEVLGMILNKMNLDQKLKTESKTLNDDLENVLNKAKIDKLFNSLEQIQIHFPQIIDNFLRKIVSKMYSEKSVPLKCICLKNILRRIDSLEIPLLTSKDLIELLNIDDSDLKLLTLQVVNKMINSIKKDALLSVLNAVVENKTNSSPMIRTAVYDILITIYKQFFFEETELSKELISVCKPILLSGVIDSDIELQEKILKFWCIDRFESLTLSERFEKSLLDLYSPETESYYLGYVNYYLLEACKDTPEYDKLMFDHPLSECEFDEYQLLINWRAQHASMAPMFANTFTQQDFQLNMAVPQIIGVKATTSARVFTPTVSSIDLTSSLDTTSSFMFSPISSSVSTSSNENYYVPQLKNIERSKSHNSHSKRFLSNASKIRLGFSKAATDKRQKTDQQRRERIRRKEGNVVMYRQYRKGELPDIQIPNSAIIQPLQILARRDGFLARQLYVLLFKGLIAETKNSDDFVATYNTGVDSVLQQTHMYTPNVIGALLDIILQHNKKRGLKKININPDVLFTACKNSGLLSVGCLLLEEYINLNDDYDGPSNSKKGCGAVDTTVDYWVKLAAMYKELNEWDTVVGIFSSAHMDCSAEVSKAIAAEANSDWMEASKKYKNLLFTDSNYSRKDFYYESYYKCYSNLSDWSGISKLVTDTFEDSLWDNDFNQEKILPWYILGEMCSLLDGASNNTILQNLTNWMRDREKADYLKDKFSAELAVLALIRKDVNASKHYTQNCFSKFLEEWSNQNPLFSKIRAKTLMNFQKIIDLNKYLTCREQENDILNQITYFERNFDLISNSVMESEIRTLCRYLVLRSFENKLKDLDMEEHTPSLQDLRLTSDLNLIAYSLEKNNSFVAKKYCRKNGKYLNAAENPLARFRLINSMAKIGIMNADLAENAEKVSKLISTWELVESKKFPETYVDFKIESLQILSQISQNIYDVLKNSTDLIQANKTKIQSLISAEGTYPNNLLNYSEENLKAAISLGEKYSSQSQNKKLLNGLTEAYLSFVAFAQQQVDQKYAKDIVRCVLRAMKIGSKNARQLFPCLLELENLETSLLQVFQGESLSVPTWMFILWIPQLLARLNTSKYVAFEDIVSRLAITYPHALIYPYKMAKERHGLKSGDDYFDTTISKLDEWLKHDLAEKFLFELSCLCIPELYLKYHLIKIFKNFDETTIKDDLRLLEENIVKKLESSRNFKSIEDPFKKFMKKNTGRINSEVMKQNLKSFINENNIRYNALKKKYNYLEQCSPWLATFQATEWTEELEIPGQYSGDTKPMVKYHSKISSFSNKISMWSSLRKPIKIVIYGNDAKEYPFIVKFGEDIRQDQRIQQLFSLSNSILLSDSSCQQRNLFVEQYQVIPLTTSLGLIQMLENNSGLGSFMFKTVDKKTEEYYSTKICEKYTKWIKGTSAEHFWKACQTRSKDETNQIFTGLVSEVPANILSESFWAISLDTESYAFRRNQFIVSYSTMCLVHWLLGIGDRNLDNCLVLQKTGRAVGIDFGCAFGTASQHFPIPELIPFRLTPHILSLMEPLRDIGFVEQTMVHCLRALRKQKHILLSTMNIFVSDPSVDWLEFSRKEDYINDSSDWYPIQKITIAKRKLDGANPAKIIIDELHMNAALTDKKVLKAYSEIAKGDGSNIRCTLAEDGLSEEDQVKALLDQATDYNILGRMYYGLRLWI